MKDSYHRQAARRETDGKRETVVNAFSDAWKRGQRFSITMEDDGAVKVKIGTKLHAYYRDAEDFAADVFPELLQ